MADIIRATSLTDAYADYLGFLDAAPRTVQTYKGNIRQFVKWTAQRGIQRPTRQDVIAYRDELKTRCKPATVQAYITALRIFFAWTEQAGIYPNIAARVKGAKLDTNHKKDALTAAQAKILLGSIDRSTAQGKRDYCIIVLMLTGGLRDIEISRADLEDLQPGRLYLQGKGREERTEFIKIVPAAQQALDAYLKVRAPGSSLFTSYSNQNRGGRLTARSISRLVKDKLKAAGMDSDRLTAHSLRHAAVTLALLGGLPLDEVQQFARHRNITTTQIYAHNLERAQNRSEDTIARSIFADAI